MQDKIPNRTSVLEQLERILQSVDFANSPKLSNFISYIVKVEADGNGDRIKAFSIGVDALGRSETFDPQADNIVRVTAGRARQALGRYYDGPGQHDAIKISLPKGTYRPRFEFNTPFGVDRALAINDNVPSRVSVRATPAVMVLAFLTVCVLTISVFLAWGPNPNSNSDRGDGFRADMPIVEIATFEETGEAELDALLDGLRHRIAEDLSRFRVARIRLEPHTLSPSNRASRSEAADFSLKGVVISTSPTMLQISIIDRADDTLLWSKTTELPDDWKTYSSVMDDGIRSVVLQLVGARGAIPLALERDLAQFATIRSDTEGAPGSGFRCVLLFHAYDASKGEAQRQEAHACLSALIDQDNRDSEVWAAWAMLNFLDWTKAEDYALLDRALSAARKAVSLDPNYANAHEYLGSILMAQGRRGLARESYETALDLNPYKPDLHVLVGWEQALAGDWQSGVEKIERGIAMSPIPAAWMRIPLALDAFRQKDFERSLMQAELMIEAGDDRGIVLALAAAIALGDDERSGALKAQMQARSDTYKSDPMREIRGVFNAPELLSAYERTLAPWLLEPA